MSFLCVCPPSAWCLLWISCVEVLLGKVLQRTQSFSSSCAFEAFTKKGFTRYAYWSLGFFFFFTACPWQQHQGPWITSPPDTVGEVIRVPDVALAKTSFLCLPLFLASAWCLLWILRVGAIFLVASRKAENKNQNLISILSESDRIEIRFWFLLESFYSVHREMTR